MYVARKASKAEQEAFKKIPLVIAEIMNEMSIGIGDEIIELETESIKKMTVQCIDSHKEHLLKQGRLLKTEPSSCDSGSHCRNNT